MSYYDVLNCYVSLGCISVTSHKDVSKCYILPDVTNVYDITGFKQSSFEQSSSFVIMVRPTPFKTELLGNK